MRLALVPGGDPTLTGPTGRGSSPQELASLAPGRREAAPGRDAGRRGQDGLARPGTSTLLPSRPASRVERLARGCDLSPLHPDVHRRECRSRGRISTTWTDCPVGPGATDRVCRPASTPAHGGPSSAEHEGVRAVVVPLFTSRGRGSLSAAGGAFGLRLVVAR